MSVTPSWEHYGTHDDSAYPELWDRCVGAWAPCLGPTGEKVVNHAELKSGAGLVVNPASTAFTASKGYPSYYNSVNNGYLSLEFPLDISGPSDTLTAWFYWTQYPSSYTAQAFYRSNSGSVGNNIRGLNYLGLPYIRRNGTHYLNTWNTIIDGGQTISLNEWHSIALIATSTRYEYWLDGKLSLSGSCSGTVSDALYYLLDNYTLTQAFIGYTADIQIHLRALSPDEIRTLAAYPGAMYTPRRPRRFYSFPGFLAAWARHRNASLIGGGLC